MNTKISKIALIGLFIALGTTLGFALATIPNVELVTATIFLAGFLMGIREGLLVGLLTESIYSILNPYGMAAPPLFIAQILSMGLVGCLGGWMGRQGIQTGWRGYLRLGLAGFITTLFFAVVTTLAFLVFIDFSTKSILSSFIVGLGFYTLHILSNTLIFISVVPALIRVSIRTTLFPAVSAGKNS